MIEPVYLRSLETSDFDRIHKWHNDRNLYLTLTNPFHFVSKQAVSSWLENKCQFNANEVNLAICMSDNDEHIGNIYLRQIDWIARNCQLGIFIGESTERYKGFGKSAVSQLLFHAYSDLGLNKVYLHVFTDNRSAVHVYKQCGFEVEGTLKNYAFKKGAWKDLHVMGVCLFDHFKKDEFVDPGD